MKKIISALSILLLTAGMCFAQSDLQVLTIVKYNKSESITVKQLKTRCDTYEKQLGQKLTLEQKKQVLSSLVDEKLVLQAAAKAGITIADSSVDQYFLEAMSQSIGASVTEKQLNDYFKTQGTTLDAELQKQTGMNVADYKAYLKNQLIAQQYVIQQKQNEIQAAASPYYYYHFEKYGDGTLKLEGDGKAVRLESTLYGGTFILGASNSMTNEFVLAGGNLAVADGKSNSLGNLTVNTNATLTVGAGGTLSFASFTAGEGLQPKAITIEAPLTGNVLRFGTNNAALNSEQRACFRWKDTTDASVLYRVKIDENGYVHPCTSGIVISVK